MRTNLPATTTATVPARRLTLRTARPIPRREAPVPLSTKVSKAHRERMPRMDYADRVTANLRTWDNHGTSRSSARARLADAVGTSGRTLASI